MDSATELRDQGKAFIDYFYIHRFLNLVLVQYILVLEAISDAGSIDWHGMFHSA